MYSGFRIVNLYLFEKQFYHLDIVLIYGSFYFWLFQSSFISKITYSAPLYPHLFHEFISYLCNICRCFFHNPHFIPESSDRLIIFFKFTYIKVHSFVLQRSMGFDKCIVSCIHHYCTTDISSSSLNQILCTSLYHTLLPP